jgi:hypothetical protein
LYRNARHDIYSIRFAPRFDGDFFAQEPGQLLHTAPPKPTLMGATEVEWLIYGSRIKYLYNNFLNRK